MSTFVARSPAPGDVRYTNLDAALAAAKAPLVRLFKKWALEQQAVVLAHISQFQSLYGRAPENTQIAQALGLSVAEVQYYLDGQKNGCFLDEN